MRRAPAILLTVLALVCVAATTVPAPAAASAGAPVTTTPEPVQPTAPAPTKTPGPDAAARQRTLDRALAAGMRLAGVYSGAEVVDLSTGQTLYAHNADTPRLPASVEKLYTTSSALTLFGPDGRLSTTVLGNGSLRSGTYRGTLYLRGGGDPTFGSAAFDHSHYGTGASVQQLAAKLHQAGIDAIDGRIVADGSIFDSDKGTPATGNRPSIEVEGELAGLDYNRGWASDEGTVYYADPVLEAGIQLRAAMQAAGIRVSKSTHVTTGRTPATATPLASVASPTIAKLLKLTNTPSDNFFAETLLKDLGARFGSGGTTAAGVTVVQRQVASLFGTDPRFNDGSGLSRYDRTTPAQVIKLLSVMADTKPFTRSLAVAGRTGTLVDEMRGTYAQGRCRGKTGTLHDVSNLVGYCTAQDGDRIAYALLMNGVIPDAAHPIQDRMVVAISRYDG